MISIEVIDGIHNSAADIVIWRSKLIAKPQKPTIVG